MLRKSSLVSVMLAVLLGLGAALLARNWMAGRVEAAEASRSEGSPVVVATAEIPFGARVRADQVRVIYWPRDSAPAGVFTDAAAVVGLIANQKILAGETVLQQRVAQTASGSSLASLIQPNRRALTVRVNDVIGVAGFLLPGNRVDVLTTRLNDERRAHTRTLLENVKVLAVDQSAQIAKDQPVVVRAVTLELQPHDAELLVQATEEGTVQLALRNPDDAAKVAAREDPEAKVVVRERAVTKPAGVEIIRQTTAGGGRP